MDPNAALISILHGHMVLDHVEGLRDWIRSGGFPPDPILVPADPEALFSAWRGMEVYVDARGLFIPSRLGEVCRWTWNEILEVAEECTGSVPAMEIF